MKSPTHFHLGAWEPTRPEPLTGEEKLTLLWAGILFAGVSLVCAALLTIL
jgi:hypothetical protein